MLKIDLYGVAGEAENYLTEDQKIDGYIAILEDPKIQVPTKAIEKLGEIAKRGNQKVVDALLKVRFNDKEVAKSLGRVANIGDRRVINILIAWAEDYSARKSLLILAPKGDQQVIEKLLPIAVRMEEMPSLVQLGATTDQLYSAIIKYGNAYQLEKIVFNGEFIDTNDADRINKIEKAKSRLIVVYIDELSSEWSSRALDRDESKKTIQRFVEIAGKGNQKAISLLIQKLLQNKVRKLNLIRMLGEIVVQGDLNVLGFLRNDIEARYNDMVSNDNHIPNEEDYARIQAVQNIVGHNPPPSWLQKFMDEANLRSSLHYFLSSTLIPYFSLSYWRNLGVTGRERLGKVVDLIRSKLSAPLDKYSRDNLELKKADIEKAISLYNRDGDFKVIYHSAKWEGVSTFDGVITIGGSGISQPAFVDIIPIDRAMQTLEVVKSPENGGIDLNQINVKRNGKTVNVQFDPAQLNALEQAGFTGFSFKIENITRISSPFQLLGINAPTKQMMLVKA